MKKKKFHFPTFDCINGLLMVLICLACILPFWIIVVSSFSPNSIFVVNESISCNITGNADYKSLASCANSKKPF